MKKLTILFASFSLVLFACNSADSQAPEIAQDYCNCFTPVTNTFSETSKNLIIKASNDKNHPQGIQQEMAKLSAEEQAKVKQELMVFGEMNNPNSTLNKCVIAVQEKYKTAFTTDKDGFMKKIIKELEKKDECKITASLLKLGLAASEGNK